MKNFSFLLFIILIIAVGQMAADISLPSLSEIAYTLHSSVHLVQFSVSSYLLGLGISQIFYGILSDSIGRKKTLIFGLILFIFGSFFCAFSQSILAFIISRLIQGIGAASTIVVAGAIIRDSFNSTLLPTYVSYFAIASNAVVASSPLLGGYIQHFFSWRANFIFLLGYAMFILFYSVFLLHETNHYRNVENIRFSTMIRNIFFLINKENMVYISLIFMGYGGVLLWLTFCPVLMYNKFHVLPYQFGWIAFVGGLVYIAGGFINGKLVGKLGINLMIFIGATILSAAGILMFSLFFISNVYSIILPIMLSMIGVSMILPNAFAGALIPVPHLAGLMAAIVGTMQFFGGFISTLCASLLPKNNQLPIGGVFLLYGFISLLLIISINQRGFFIKNACYKNIYK